MSPAFWITKTASVGTQLLFYPDPLESFPPFGVPLSASACFLAAVLDSCLQRTALVCWTVSPTDEESWQCQGGYISLGRTCSRWMTGWREPEGPAILLWGQTLKYSLLPRLPLGALHLGLCLNMYPLEASFPSCLASPTSLQVSSGSTAFTNHWYKVLTFEPASGVQT